MAVDSDGNAAKRGADGGVRPAQSSGAGDGGWSIFKGTTPYLVHDGVRVSPPRYHLNIDFPDAPTGASNILDTILEKNEGGPATPSTIAEPPKEESPSKKALETEQLSITAATTTAVPGGDLLIVEPAAALSEL